MGSFTFSSDGVRRVLSIRCDDVILGMDVTSKGSFKLDLKGVTLQVGNEELVLNRRYEATGRITIGQDAVLSPRCKKLLMG